MSFKKRIISLMLFILTIAMALAGCSSGENKGTSGKASSGSPASGENAALTGDLAFSAGISDSFFSHLIYTGSAYNTSFLRTLDHDVDVIYLGKPKNLGTAAPENYSWSSSDESVAIVRNGAVLGLKEGVVTITRSGNGEADQKWEYAVTTFNDGRQAELSYTLGEDRIREMLSKKNCISSPYYLKQNINTLQDAITYFQLRGFERKPDLPMMCTGESDWIWFVPGDLVLMENCGILEDVSTAAAYLLADDFEDCGYIYAFGDFYATINWFYEDGYYYAFCFNKMLNDFTNDIRNGSYDILRTDSLEDLAQYALENAGGDNTMSVILISTSGYDFRPPMKMSYLHDSSAIYHEHVTIGLEDAVFSRSTELYSNPDFDYEIVSIPAAEIPAGIPRFGEESGYRYE